MTLEEYKQELAIAESQYKAQKVLLAKMYANSNNPYKVGDIVTDHIGAAKIKSISYHISIDGIPQCVFTAVELKKDLTPKKGDPTRSVYQRNIK